MVRIGDHGPKCARCGHYGSSHTTQSVRQPQTTDWRDKHIVIDVCRPTGIICPCTGFDHGLGYLVVVVREGGQLPYTVEKFATLVDAQMYFDGGVAEQWSDSYIAKIVRGPLV